MRETQVLTIPEKPVKTSMPKAGGEGLGSAMTTAGTRNSATWTKAVAEILVLPGKVYAEESMRLKGRYVSELWRKCWLSEYAQNYRAYPLQRHLRKS